MPVKLAVVPKSNQNNNHGQAKYWSHYLLLGTVVLLEHTSRSRPNCVFVTIHTHKFATVLDNTMIIRIFTLHSHQRFMTTLWSVHYRQIWVCLPPCLSSLMWLIYQATVQEDSDYFSKHQRAQTKQSSLGDLLVELWVQPLQTVHICCFYLFISPGSLISIRINGKRDDRWDYKKGNSLGCNKWTGICVLPAIAKILTSEFRSPRCEWGLYLEYSTQEGISERLIAIVRATYYPAKGQYACNVNASRWGCILSSILLLVSDDILHVALTEGHGGFNGLCNVSSNILTLSSNITASWSLAK